MGRPKGSKGKTKDEVVEEAKDVGVNTEPKAFDEFEAVDASLEKAFGHRIVQRIDDTEIKRIPAFPTGSLTLDIAIGIGGFPRGRLVEIFGNESVGKSTLVMHLAKSVQDAGGFVLYVDPENCFDPEYGKTIGIDFSGNKFRLVQPETAQEAEGAIRAYLTTGKVALIIVDSVAALSEQSEQDREVGKPDQMALLARFMSPFVRRLNPLANKTNTLICFTNQNRDSLNPYGAKQVQPGGRALKFYSSVRIELSRKEDLLQGDQKYGIRTKFVVRKNKVSTPFREGLFDIVWGKGISREAELVDLGMEFGIIEKKKSSFFYGEVSLGVGRNQSIDFLKENKDTASSIEAAIKKTALPE